MTFDFEGSEGNFTVAGDVEISSEDLSGGGNWGQGQKTITRKV